MSEITGRLEGWTVQHHPDVAEYIIWGVVYNDVHHRFPDGTCIHTSGVDKALHPVEELREGDAIKTRNSVYQLGKRQARAPSE